MDFIVKKFDTSHHSVLSFIEKNGETLKDIKIICMHPSSCISNPEWSVMAIDLKKMLSNFKEFNGRNHPLRGYRKV